MSGQSEMPVEPIAASTPIVRRKLGQEVLARLLADVREGVHSVDSLLPSEREPMAQFGVGRPAMREGLHLTRANLIYRLDR